MNRIYLFLRYLGFDFKALLNNLAGFPTYVSHMRRYSATNPRESFRVRLGYLLPILDQFRSEAGSTNGHYFHQDLWAAKKIYERRPLDHLDIGSRIDGFITHLLVFMEVTLVDVRPTESQVKGLKFVRSDATNLREFADNSVDSLSSLHAAEHFGLGRYGDPIDADACFLFMKALQRVLRPGGRLYFSVPIGTERVNFNAHRVFAPRTIMDAFGQLQLVSFSVVGGDGKLYEGVDPAKPPAGEGGCGLWEFTKAS